VSASGAVSIGVAGTVSGAVVSVGLPSARLNHRKGAPIAARTFGMRSVRFSWFNSMVCVVLLLLMVYIYCKSIVSKCFAIYIPKTSMKAGESRYFDGKTYHKVAIKSNKRILNRFKTYIANCFALHSHSWSSNRDQRTNQESSCNAGTSQG
jgi:hypothetical protein